MNIQNTISLGQPAMPELRAADTARSPSSAPAPQPRPEPTPQQVQQAVQHINRALQTARNTALQFSVDQGTDMMVVRVVDSESGELIRQIPSDAALAIAASINDFQKGLLLSQEV